MDKSKIIDFLAEPIENFIKGKIEKMFITAVEKISSVLSRILSSLLFIFCFIGFFFFASIALALLISDLIGKSYAGFIVISLLYLMAGILFFIMRKKLFKKSVMQTIIGELNQNPEYKNPME